MWHLKIMTIQHKKKSFPLKPLLSPILASPARTQMKACCDRWPPSGGALKKMIKVKKFLFEVYFHPMTLNFAWQGSFKNNHKALPNLNCLGRKVRYPKSGETNPTVKLFVRQFIEAENKEVVPPTEVTAWGEYIYDKIYWIDDSFLRSLFLGTAPL